ncbi:MAG TPA: PCRF domain-containing protein, partial [Alphaproteobacteria bacterium]|nr:PCRF domain-containing protein [Alphaproteobacteria bacterium]
MNIDERLDRIVARQDELSALLSAGQQMARDELVRLSKEYAELKPVIGAIEALRAAKSEAADLAEMIADQDTDSEVRALAEEEFRALKERIPELDGQLKILLLPKDEADEKNAILEIRAGTGGDEAALFAANLMRMYQRYSEEKKWRSEIMSLSETGIGGVKEVIMEIGGRGAFARL